MLLGLVPFVESNYNLIELGPRETGKIYTFCNTSNRSFVVSGGKATPVTLFYNKGTRKLGVVGRKHVVFFDDIANTRVDEAESRFDHARGTRLDKAKRTHLCLVVAAWCPAAWG